MVYNEQDIEDYVVDCPNCGTENNITNDSCINCGYDIRTCFCPECNTLNYYNEKYCQNCNYKLNKNKYTFNKHIKEEVKMDQDRDLFVTETSQRKYRSIIIVCLILVTFSIIDQFYPYEYSLQPNNLIYTIIIVIVVAIFYELITLYYKNKKNKRMEELKKK